MKKTTRITALLLSLVLIVSTLVSCGEFDYEKTKLDGYVFISEEDYKNYGEGLLFDEITDADLARKINKLLYANRSEEAKGGGTYYRSIAITVGDDADVYYRGYTIDENGKQIEVEGSCNFNASSHTTLGIGSESFIPGFEEGLIGVVPNQIAQFKKIATGNVLQGSVAYVSYTAVYPDGESKTVTAERIVLSKADVDAAYGDGFYAYLTALDIGKKYEDATTFPYEDGTAAYDDVKVEYVTDCELADNVYTIEAYFPANYAVKELRGKHVYFDVYVKRTVVYDVPEYNEAFIKDTLKLTDADLASYEGDGIVEKHKNMLLAELEEEFEADRKSIIEEAMWEHYNAKAVIHKLPESELKKVYDDYYDDLVYNYQNYYSGYYASLEAFAKAYYGLSDGESYSEYFERKAEDIVKEKLVFYYIMQKESIKPSRSKYNEIYNEVVEEYLAYYCESSYAEELEACKTDKEREDLVKEIKKNMLDYYGDEYFRELVYYNYALDVMISYANVD